MPFRDQRSGRSSNRPADSREREMRVEPVLDDDAGLPQQGAQIGLQASQLRQIGAGDARPEHLSATNARKRADPLRLESDAAVLSNHRRQINLQCRDGVYGEVPEEMQRQMNALHVIDTNPIAKRLQLIDSGLEPGSQRVREINRQEDAPALGFSLRRGCPPLPRACRPAATQPRGRRQTS